MKLFLKLIAVLITWLAWKQSASLTMCWLFWVTLLAVELSLAKSNLSIALVAFGTACNATVTLLNNGIMPVVDMPITFQPANPIWQAASSKHLALALADHASFWYFSIGDFLCQAGGLVLAVKFVRLTGGSMFKKLLKEETGQDIAEYAVMLAVILVIVIGVVRMIGTNSQQVFSNVASSLNTAN